MTSGRMTRAGAAVVLGLGLLVGTTARADAPQTSVLATIEPGQWQLTDTDSDASRRLCVRDPRVLLQLGHPGTTQCSRFVVSQSPRELTVHYTCPGAGHGRTTIGIVTPRSIKLETQGIAGGLPFQQNYAGRRVGACG